MYQRHLHFHFVGIGGVGMSGIAELLINLGYKVSGSDLNWSDACERLTDMGATVGTGHAAENLPQEASLLVYSSAVSAENPEILEAQERRIPVIRRAEVLAELMRLKYGIGVAGSHGKTTTTSMIAKVMEKGGLDPTMVVGGKVTGTASGSRLGQGQFLVAEADESDKSFLLLRPSIAVVTNIDQEHLEAYSSFEELQRAFQSFIEQVPFYGVAVLCFDDPLVRDVAKNFRGRVLSYGLGPQPLDVRAIDIVTEEGQTSFHVSLPRGEILPMRLAVPGRHMVQNALAAVAVGIELELAPQTIAEALAEFAGVARRLETISFRQGVRIMSDYAHHPTEIRATLQAVREGYMTSGQGRLRVVFQPHRYTRTKDCFAQFLESFAVSDEVYITDIYPAGESAIENVTGKTLADAIAAPQAEYSPSLAEAGERVRSLAKEGDVVLFLGAGSVGRFAEAFGRDSLEKI